MTQRMREMIIARLGQNLRSIAVMADMSSLSKDGLNKVRTD
jgi:hypothetical protein